MGKFHNLKSPFPQVDDGRVTHKGTVIGFFTYAEQNDCLKIFIWPFWEERSG